MTRVIVWVTLVAVAAAPAHAEWFFRGTPNDWGTTAMTAAAGGTAETCQSFAGTPDPRFKIDRHGDWRESYPAEDQRVGEGAYWITFDAVTGHRITVSGGSITFHVKGNSAGVYVLDGTGKIGADGVLLR